MTIPYSRQKITNDDIEAVIEVLKSDYLTQGPCVPIFENEVASYCGAKKAVAVNSATSALHLACMALNIREGDLVWTSAITFVATANAAIYCGAKIDFLDINPVTYNIDINLLSEKLEISKKNKSLPKLIIVVHMGGQSCEMDKIFDLSEKYGFKIIEDASHALGAKYKNIPVGKCKYSDITVFSFHPVKPITSGEGGMALTNDLKLFAKMERLRSHGITRNETEMIGGSDGPWFYQQLDLGFNYRMSDIHAALGISQMKKINDFVKKRQKIAQIYDKIIDNHIATTPKIDANCYSSYHLYILQLNLDYLNKTQKQVFEKLRNEGFYVNLHYIPVYRHPYFRKNGHKNTFLKNSENFYKKAISIPIYVDLNEKNQNKIIDLISTPLGYQTIF